MIGCVLGRAGDEPQIATRELDPISTADQRIFGALRKARLVMQLEARARAVSFAIALTEMQSE